MENSASISFPSIPQFEDFVERYPDAENVAVSGSHIIASSPAPDRNHQTNEALKKALREHYPGRQNLLALVDTTWDSLRTEGKSWDAHTIGQVIDKAWESGTWREVGDAEISEENIAGDALPLQGYTTEAVVAALDRYARTVVEGLSPEELGQWRNQMLNAGLVTSVHGLTGLTAQVYSPAANAALAHLLVTIASTLPRVGTELPVGHLLSAAFATLGTAATANVASGAVNTVSSVVTTSIASATSAIVPLIVAGAIAHRIFIAMSRVAQEASAIEHEVNNVTTAMIAAALATLPHDQHAVLLSSILGGVVGQHFISRGMIRQTCHNVRDAALGVYLVQHPEIAISLATHIKTLLLSAVGSSVATIGSSVATPTTATAAAQTASAALLPHSITAVTAHGLSSAAACIVATIAAHPPVLTAVFVGGVCAAAYQYVYNTSSTSTMQPPL